MLSGPIVADRASKSPKEDAEDGGEKANGANAAERFRDEANENEGNRARGDSKAKTGAENARDVP